MRRLYSKHSLAGQIYRCFVGNGQLLPTFDRNLACFDDDIEAELYINASEFTNTD